MLDDLQFYDIRFKIVSYLFYRKEKIPGHT